MKLVRRSAFVSLMAAITGGCTNFSTPYLDEQGRLDEQRKSGAITKEQYNQALSLQREKPWGATGEIPPPAEHYSF